MISFAMQLFLFVWTEAFFLDDSHGFRNDPHLAAWLRTKQFDDCNVVRITSPAPIDEELKSYMNVPQPVILASSAHSQWTFDSLLDAERGQNSILEARQSVGRFFVGNVYYHVSLDSHLGAMQRATFGENVSARSGIGTVFSGMHSIFPKPINGTEPVMHLLKRILNTTWSTYLSVGPSREGVSLHYHDAFTFTVEQGRKFFVVLPPGHLEKQDEHVRSELAVLPPLEALSRHSDFFASEPVMRCTLGPGETVVVPHNWPHMTLAVGDTLGFSNQFVLRTKGASDSNFFWTRWCEKEVILFAKCQRKLECVEKHAASLGSKLEHATKAAPFHQCVSPILALRALPQNASTAASILRKAATAYVDFVGLGFDKIAAAEVLATWAEIASRFLADNVLMAEIIAIGEQLFEPGSYWRFASMRRRPEDAKRYYHELQRQLDFRQAPECELRKQLSAVRLLSGTPWHDEL
eukprot:TRINITY_DN69196_c0_g1_i1.p1 TRINITY_DN69196_c0_g1~~TRINITY_DN69196_c0_g1_i1.p1  ORF type:complete len:465 (+),score=71.84 TRINITY_DN69196_c0_g1_i1:33-1427(+)